jgi:hypothetical protein
VALMAARLEVVTACETTRMIPCKLSLREAPARQHLNKGF